MSRLQRHKNFNTNCKTVFIAKVNPNKQYHHTQVSTINERQFQDLL